MKIFGSQSRHMDLTTLSPYILTSSQIFFYPALPLSQGNNLLHITVFESRFFFSLTKKIFSLPGNVMFSIEDLVDIPLPSTS